MLIASEVVVLIAFHHIILSLLCHSMIHFRIEVTDYDLHGKPVSTAQTLFLQWPQAWYKKKRPTGGGACLGIV